MTDRWFPHFTTHGDPHVIADPRRPWSTHIAAVDTAAEDYGRANALLIAAAPKMREALLALRAWDMLTLDSEGRGVATADAPWARALIDDALDLSYPDA